MDQIYSYQHQDKQKKQTGWSKKIVGLKWITGSVINIKINKKANGLDRKYEKMVRSKWIVFRVINVKTNKNAKWWRKKQRITYQRLMHRPLKLSPAIIWQACDPARCIQCVRAQTTPHCETQPQRSCQEVRCDIWCPHIWGEHSQSDIQIPF